VGFVYKNREGAVLVQSGRWLGLNDRI